MTRINKYIYLLLTIFAMLAAMPARALAPDFYAKESKLASGTWHKISVSKSGMHLIPAATLKAWGFAAPERVNVYGYGAKRLSDNLTLNYLDDLPQAASEYVPGVGLFFYAEGPVTWANTAYDYFHPQINPFTDIGYYYLNDGAEDTRLTPAKSFIKPQMTDEADYFYDRLYHKTERVSPGEAGFLLLGEDFKTNPSQEFTFTLTDARTDMEARIETSFVCNSPTARSTVSVSINGKKLPEINTDIISPVTDKYSHGNESLSRRSFSFSGSTLKVGIKHNATGIVNLAALNYIAINYPRNLKLAASKNLTFSLEADYRNAVLSNASAQTRVWDVTNPQAINTLTLVLDGNKGHWSSPYTGARDYVAWEPSGTFPQPEYVEQVRTQNLHALDTPDMVIFTPKAWRAQAEQLADFHRTHPNDPLDVLVLTPGEIYNEFSSGSPDVQAFRKLLKMLYDRDGGRDKSRLKYALFFSRLTFDPRLRTSEVAALNYPMLPAWFTNKGLNDNDSYTSDDYMAFLEDGSGVNVGRDRLSIAIGRIPVTSSLDAQSAVDKILRYSRNMPKSIWRNNVLIVADDQDNGVHMEQAERMWNNMVNNGGNDAFYKKLYTDEYELIGNKYPVARTQLYRMLDEGVMWWTFQGHANTSSLTGESLVTYRDLNELYLNHYPVIYGATCDFLRWDAPAISGAEILFRNPDGGVIAAISATRPVYINDNGYLSESFGNKLFQRDEKGRLLTLGEIYRQAKNNYRFNGTVVSNTNKLRYVLLGDPAMRLAMPDYRVVLDQVAGVPVENFNSNTAEPPTLMARQQTTISGHIEDGLGNLVTDFTGVVSATLYDAEYSVTTRGNGEEGKPVTFDQQGGRLALCTDSIKAGRFTARLVMPAEVADNYRPAAFNLYASGQNGTQAIGVCRDFYVYGTDPNALPDDVPPVIHEMYLNHPTFANGQDVNPSPMLMATITDDRAINLSTAGIGHQMVLYLDNGSKSYTDVADYFTPFTDGRNGGTIAYPITGLGGGNHSLRLRVWDTGPNSAEASVDFNVVENLAPKIYDVYSDANPATYQANFYLVHDRPDRKVSVTIEVFDLMGRRLWQATRNGRSDMFTSSPVTWDLCDQAGHRVNRGIYLYRATISDQESGEKTSTATRKLAVAGL